MATFDIVILSSSPPRSSDVACANGTPPSPQQRVRMPAIPLPDTPHPEPSARRPIDASGAASTATPEADASATAFAITARQLEPQQCHSAPNTDAAASLGSILPSYRLKAGSRVAPVPQGVRAGFASAGSLVRSLQFNLESDDETNESHNAHAEREIVGRKQMISGKSTGRFAEENRPPGDPTSKPSSLKHKSRKAQAQKGKVSPETAHPNIPESESSYFTQCCAVDHNEDLVVDLPKSVNTIRKSRVRKPRADAQLPAKQAVTTTTASTSRFVPDDFIHAEPTPDPPLNTTKSKSTKAKRATTKSKTAKAELENGTCKGMKAQKTIRTSKAKTRAPKKSTGAVSEHFQTGSVSGKGDCSNTHEANTCNVDNTTVLVALTAPGQPHDPLQQKQVPLDSVRPLDLEGAVARRRDWTPVKDSRPQHPFTGSSEKENKVYDADQGFTSIISNYAFAQNQPQLVLQPNIATSDGHGRMKKRKVELIDVPGKGQSTRSASPEKRKVPKKKARTITDIVTGQYAPEEQIDRALCSKNDFFEPRAAPASDDQSTFISKASRKKPGARQKSGKDDTRSKKASAKAAAKPKMMANALLSPSSAILKMNRQDVLFGTSSQLALEESPTMIRQIQHAIRESEMEADLLPTAPAVHTDMKQTLNTMRRLQKTEGKRQLWAAGARDEDGGLLNDQEGFYLPEPDRTQDIPLLMQDASPEVSFANIDDFDSPVRNTESAEANEDVLVSKNSPIVSPRAANIHTVNNMSFDDIDDYNGPPPSNQDALSQFPSIDKILPHSQSARTAMHQPSETSNKVIAASLPSAAISREPSQSPSRKNRTHSVFCNRASQAESPAPSTPQKWKSRFADIEEILDSEDDEALSPTPPRSIRPKGSSSLPLAPSQSASHVVHNADGDKDDLAPVYKVLASELSWPATKDSIFELITSHVRSIPPTTDPAHPSWHEKMLMYDPIVVEDFTAYLATNTSIRIFRRATKLQIKAWNKKMKATGGQVLVEPGHDEYVLAVKKELESWMVQGWCQEQSVCCISKGGRSRGGFGKCLY